MERNPAPNDFLSVEIHSGDIVNRIEQVTTAENGTRRIRRSNLRGGQPQTGHMELTEKELVTLLARAIRAGVLSSDFIRSLRAEFEI